MGARLDVPQDAPQLDSLEADMRFRGAILAGLTLFLTAATVSFASSTPSKPTRGAAKPRASAAGKARVKKSSSKHSKKREKGQKAPAPERISEIQQALAK